MTLWCLIQRSLRYYWRTGAMVVFGVAVAVAALTGSLLVGGSVTWSLRHIALARLGRIDYVLSAQHTFHEALADGLAAVPEIETAAPVLLTAGAAQNPATQAVVPRVSVTGIDDRFPRLFPDAHLPALTGREVLLNAALARDLAVQRGDAVLLTLPRAGRLSASMLFAQRKREDTTRSVRVKVAAVLPDLGPGGFNLAPSSATPRNLLIDRRWLAEQLEQHDQVNAVLLAARTDTRTLQHALPVLCTLADYGLSLQSVPEQGYVSVQSAQMVLSEGQVAALEAMAVTRGLQARPTSIYLADRITRLAGANATTTSYVTVASAQPTKPYTFLAGGTRPLEDGGLWLNRWAADDLGAQVGDRLALDYLVYQTDGTFHTQTLRFTLTGILAMSGPAVDTHLVPTIEGITDAASIDRWQAPFPLELSRVRPRDEAYWNQYRATPRAFVSEQTMQRIWRSSADGARADWVTALQLTGPAAQLGSSLTQAVTRVITPEQAGLTVTAVRAILEQSAAGTTDFGELFLSLSFFLVLAAAGLAGATMRLLVEQRASQAGIMLAQGFRSSLILSSLLGEGLLLTAGGIVIGLPLGMLYAWGIIHALATWWQGAVGDMPLWLHQDIGSLCIGALVGGCISLLAMVWGIRGLARRQVLTLLGGWQALAVLPAGGTRIAGIGSVTCLVLAVLPVGLTALGRLSPAAAFCSSGAALLGAGLFAVYLLLARQQRSPSSLTRGKLPSVSLPSLALRNAAVNRGRSLVVVGLLACAAFIIVTVAANERDLSRANVQDKASGTGGFALRAVSSTPLYAALNSPQGRADLGFSPEDEAVMQNVTVLPFLMSPGDDISCLNLARPATPRLLGAPQAMLERGGFTVQVGWKTSSPWSVLSLPTINGISSAFGDEESVTWTLHSGLGQLYTITDAGGVPVPLRINGLIAASIFGGELLVGEDAFKQIYPGITAPRYFLITTPPGKERAVAEALRRNLGDLGLQVQDTREVLNSFLRVQNTYLAMFLALGGIGVLLGTVGLLAALLRNAFERRREFALLLAVGFRRGALVRLLLLENAGLLVSGLCIGAVSALVAVLPQLSAVDAHINGWALAGWLGGIFLFGLAGCLVTAYLATGGELLEGLREE